MKKKFLVILNITLVISILLSYAAYANNLGGKWTTNIPYYNSSSDPYYGQDEQGVSGWNYVCNNRKWYKTTFTSATVIPVYNYYGSTGWAAMGQPGPDAYSGTYTYGDIRYNRTYMDGYDIYKRIAISTHEHGHIMGLAHNFDTSASMKSIMYGGGVAVFYDQWRLLAPTTRDRNDINALYN